MSRQKTIYNIQHAVRTYSKMLFLTACSHITFILGVQMLTTHTCMHAEEEEKEKYLWKNKCAKRNVLTRSRAKVYFKDENDDKQTDRPTNQLVFIGPFCFLHPSYSGRLSS